MPSDPVALIIGMGPGLSLALMQRFAEGGMRVIGFGRDPSKIGAAVAALAKKGHRVETRTGDASNVAALQAAIRSVGAEAGGVSVLIYNAYRATFSKPSSLDPDQAAQDLTVNVIAPLAAAQAVLPGMLVAKRGSIILTGGGLALDPTSWLDAASLAIGKAGLRSLAFSLNKELSGTGVHAGTVTICGQIQEGTAFAPETLAESYWAFHKDSGGGQAPELLFRG